MTMTMIIAYILFIKKNISHVNSNGNVELKVNNEWSLYFILLILIRIRTRALLHDRDPDQALEGSNPTHDLDIDSIPTLDLGMDPIPTLDFDREPCS